LLRGVFAVTHFRAMQVAESTEAKSPSRRQVVRELVEVADPARAGTYAVSRALDWLILSLIIANLAGLVAESVAGIEARAGLLLRVLEAVTVIAFSIEYLARVWSCTAAEEFSHPVWGRLRYATRPLLIIDLLAVLPFYLAFLAPHLVVLRAFRLMYFFRIAKVSRYMESLQLFGRVFQKKRHELIVTAAIVLILLFITATMLYYAETAVQPEVFSSIPAALWWAVATLTTVGYGDVFPITALGKLLGAFTAILGVGLFALPTGILGAGFVDELAAKRPNSESGRCPHCGRPINEDI
jgi:voltage-gated potassium channel